MLSNKPYLLRAFHQWIVDSMCTPILVLDAMNPKCKIPQDYVEGGEIVFNISTAAVRDLKITNELVEFTASFSGIIHIISAPIRAVLSIYAEENGEGLFLDAEEGEDDGGEGVVQFRSNLDSGVEQSSPQEAPMTSADEGAVRAKPFLKLVE